MDKERLINHFMYIKENKLKDVSFYIGRVHYWVDYTGVKQACEDGSIYEIKCRYETCVFDHYQNRKQIVYTAATLESFLSEVERIYFTKYFGKDDVCDIIMSMAEYYTPYSKLVKYKGFSRIIDCVYIGCETNQLIGVKFEDGEKLRIDDIEVYYKDFEFGFYS